MWRDLGNLEEEEEERDGSWRKKSHVGFFRVNFHFGIFSVVDFFNYRIKFDASEFYINCVLKS